MAISACELRCAEVARVVRAVAFRFLISSAKGFSARGAAYVRVRPAFAGEGRYFVRVPDGESEVVFPSQLNTASPDCASKLSSMWPLSGCRLALDEHVAHCAVAPTGTNSDLFRLIDNSVDREVDAGNPKEERELCCSCCRAAVGLSSFLLSLLARVLSVLRWD